MIYALLALGAVCFGQCVTMAYLMKLAYEERRTLNAAAYQAKQATDAARRAAAPTVKEQKHIVDEQLKLRKEMIESGGTFSSVNPFGHTKPLGL